MHIFLAGIVREAADNLAHVLTYIQDSASALAQDTSLRQHVIQLLHAAVTSATEAVERQADRMLVLLLQLRANVMLAAELPAAQLQQVTVASMHACPVTYKSLFGSGGCRC